MAKKNPDAVVTVTEHRMVKVPVDRETLFTRAKELEQSLAKRDDLELEKKRWLKAWNGHFADNQLDIKTLRDAVSTETEQERQACTAEYRENESKVVVSTPAGEVIEERPMTAEDHKFCEEQRQNELPMSGKDAASGE